MISQARWWASVRIPQWGGSQDFGLANLLVSHGLKKKTLSQWSEFAQSLLRFNVHVNPLGVC